MRPKPQSDPTTNPPAPPSPTIRRAAAADAPAIASLFLASRDDALPGLRKVHTDAEVHAWIAHVLLPRDTVWVAEQDARLLGFIALHDAWVEQLYLAPGCYRQGIGTALLTLAKQQCPAGLRLFCFQRNHRARAFYAASGFTAVRFSDGTDNEEQEPDIEFAWDAAHG